ncbi:MAG: glycosyltransferase family 2 protein [Mucinivorans sp.]
MLPKISIITVVRNDPQGLEMTLENLTHTDYPNLELVVIDGASTDSTPRVAEHYSTHMAVYISEKDSGIYDAMNKGLARATGDYVWFVNAGDTILGTDRLVELMTTDGRLADIYYGEAVVVSPSGERLGLRRKPLPRQLTWRSLRRGMVVCHQAFIVRRTIAIPYNLKYHYAADIEWQIECLRRSKNVQFTGVELCRFATGGVSTAHRRESLKERWAIMRTHYGLASTVFSHLRFIFDALTTTRYR